MTKRSQIIFLFIPAIIIVLWCLLKNAAGPFAMNFADPSFMYLTSSLNIALLSVPYHIDHPGTTVQILGALVIKIKALFDLSQGSLPEAVFSNTESYLKTINVFFVILVTAALFGLGTFVSRVSGSVYIGLISQLSCFTSENIFFGLTIFSPENFLVFVVIIFVGLIFYCFYEDDEANKKLSVVFIWAAICGAGVATKINFFPLLIIPLFFIKGFSRKSLFAVLTVTAFIVCTLPVISKYKFLFAWVTKLFTGTGLYGGGEQSVVSLPDLVQNIKLILTDNLLFLTAYVTSFAVIIYLSFLRFIKKIPLNGSQNKNIRLLAGIFVSSTLQILLVAKHYKPYYMLPALMLTVVTIFISASAVSDIVNRSFNAATVRIFFLVLFVFISIRSFMQFNKVYDQYVSAKVEALRVNKIIEENYEAELVVPTLGTSNPNYGFAIASIYAGKRREEYKRILKEKVTSSTFYDPWQKRLFSVSGGWDDPGYIKVRNSLILHTFNDEHIRNFSDLLSEKYGIKINSVSELEHFKNGEKIYRVEY